MIFFFPIVSFNGMFRINVVKHKCYGGPWNEEVTRDLRKVQNEELQYLYSSTNIITMIKSNSLRWAEHVEPNGGLVLILLILLALLSECQLLSGFSQGFLAFICSSFSCLLISICNVVA